MIRVLIADDQALVRAGLAALLSAEPDIEVVATASDGDEAVALALQLAPDVACVDVRMPGRDGISVTRELCRTDGPLHIPVLILTTFAIDDYVFGALEAGASGFMLKDSEPDEIVAAVRAVAAGDGTLDGSLTKSVISEFARRRSMQPITVAEGSDLLSPRELDILLLLAQGMSNEEIARALVLEVSTVKSHVSRMLPKIGVSSRLQAVVWAYRNRIVTVEN
ncbi:response regulator transcription factor [Demequina sp. TTPB684]|uniref:response regulator n=1 Tax=unclassified Demequina TaxID=2620311 RepID=UPI001CF0DDAD|nr:response regulator transcription factor [Demequina sp. TMPB413]MCB2414025.1 response regulator transcription factor [Demequina sp. TTPB684]UPU89094.1 response regulator transcription factor [Demequina sp. TMPB413]